MAEKTSGLSETGYRHKGRVSRLSSRRTALFGVVSGAACVAGLASYSGAATVTWDPTNVPTSPVGGAGTWDNATTSNWSNGTSDAQWTSLAAPTATAQFGGTAGTVTLSSSPIIALGVTAKTTGYQIGASGSTNILQIGSTTVSSQPVIDTSAFSGGSLTFGAPVGLAGVSNNAALDPLVNLGTNTINFNGLEDVGVSVLNVTVNGTGTINANATGSGAYGLTGADATAAWVLSNSASGRTWNILAGTTPGANMTVNGIITGSTTNSANTLINYATGGTLTLTSTASDFTTAAAKGVEVSAGSTLSLGVGNGASGIGVLGARTNTLSLGALSSTPAGNSTLLLTSAVTLDNPIQFSGNSTAGTLATIVLANNGTSVLTTGNSLTNEVSLGQLNVNEGSGNSGSVTFAGTVNTSSSSSNKTLTFAGNAPITLAGLVQNGGTPTASTAGHIAYAGTSTLTISGTLSEAGSSTFSSGTTLLDGSSTSATNTFNVTGGTLGGVGTITGAVSLTTGTLAPGDTGPGVLSTGNLNMSGGALAIDLGGASPGDAAGNYDQVAVTGTVTLAGTLGINIVNAFSPTLGEQFTIVNNDLVDAVTGSFTNGPTFTDNVGNTYSISYAAGDGNDVVLTVASVALVPEPMSWGLLVLATVGTLARRRKRATA